jgi:hypothetical protein
MIHGWNDKDISWRMGEENYRAAIKALKDVGGEDVEVQSQGDWGETIKKQATYKDEIKVEWHLLMQGGHNRIVADVPVALAVMRGLGI